MDKPWGEMQKGSESKQVIDRELKKVSTLMTASLVVCFALHTINSPSHSLILYYRSFAEEEEEER